ncbi:glycosyl transferase family 4-domain-containing protein [Kockovaella imperatae]|uniref:UDP-N-acetylglucosamine--dolichyl-phosphate N-acetylglucosaminephosphotransferase n=1 Tax=Kockovaella imperatae TaxID=4999 RepID=A0A1Y1UCF4_9TREE|nr:glycosyl transferase family 4-domain-containing protein [Kockovaella imperatae]ORX34755.1 glycosyl transferase family 4-domain-containing protein [Kockovaella imperatae]
MKEESATWGHAPPKLMTMAMLPIAVTLIAHPLLPLLLPDNILNLLPDLPPQPTFPALQASIGFSFLSFLGIVWTVPSIAQPFADKGLRGRDLCKPGGRESGPWVPECMGLPLACWYIALMMLFIPFPFSHMFTPRKGEEVGRETFPQAELSLYLSSLLSLFTATLLGFLDDLFDIRWRHKLPIPLIASVPMLLVYYSEGGLTSVVLPRIADKWLSAAGLHVGRVVNLGPLYYLYLILVPTFTTNAINILAGINGVEAIQALVIAASILLNDLLFLPIWPRSFLIALGGVGNPHEGRLLHWAAGEVVKRHLMSSYFMMPLVGGILGFLWHNWYPARAFPGDTFCYFTGMAFSAVAIQGHFSKTLILFFIPQIFNFILSCPQIFHIVPCPRHRLPKYSEATDTLSPSVAEFTKPLTWPAIIILRIFEALRLVRLTREVEHAAYNGKGSTKQVSTRSGRIISCTNMTILNFLLVNFGPMRESSLCTLLGAIQVGGSLVAFGVRYGMASWVYGGDRR